MVKRKSSRRASKSGQVYKDGDRWRVALEVGRDPTTGRPKYRTVRTATHAEAVDELNRMIKEHGSMLLGPAAKKNLGAFLDDWLASVIKPTKAPKTYDGYAYVVEKHLKPHLGSKPIERVTTRDLQSLLAAKTSQKLAAKDKAGKNKRDQTLSPATLRKIAAVTHTALERAKNEGLIARNPADAIEQVSQRQATPKFLNPDQAKAFLEAVDKSDLGDLFAFMLLTGTRLAEACGVRWEDLELSKPEFLHVTIRGQLQRTDGKLQYRSTTKTNQVRTISLNSFIANRLKELQTRRMVDGAKPDPDGLVFLNAEGRRIDQRFAGRRLADLCGEAEVPVISAHKLRHSAASLLLAMGVELHTVAKILGHSQVRLTADLYGHVVPESVRVAVNKLDALTPPQRA